VAKPTNRFCDEIINSLMRNQADTYSKSCWVALSEASFDETATTTVPSESAGSGYQRNGVGGAALVLNAPSAGVTANTNPVVFTASGAWTAVVSMYLIDVVSGAGNVLGGANITSATLASGETLTFGAGDIDVTFD